MALVGKDTGLDAGKVHRLSGAEAEGYAVLLGTDHLGRLASLPLLQAAAEATSLRIGALVLNNDFRQPVLLAQELATLVRGEPGGRGDQAVVVLAQGYDTPGDKMSVPCDSTSTSI